MRLAALHDTGIPEASPESRHSDAHRIAVSQEGRNNPVMALSLIKKRVSSEKAIMRLAASPRQLSRFTQRKMEAGFPGWELLDRESQNTEAFLHTRQHNDSNGYVASMAAALKKLESFQEPFTAEDLGDYEG